MVSHLRISRWLPCLIFLSVLLCLSVASWAKPAPPRPAAAPAPAPLALVNGKPLTGATFQEEVMGGYASRVLDEIIRRRVIWDEAARLKIVVTHGELDAHLKTLKQPYGSEHGFEDMLRSTGETEAHFVARVKTDMLLDKIADARGQVTAADLQTYYDKHKASYVHPPRVHLFDLVTTDVDAAYTARRRISDGETFVAVAKQMSVAPSAAKGGDLGWVRAEDVPAGLMRATAFSLEPAQVSNPLLVDNQYHILYVSEVEKGASQTLDQVKPQVLAAVKAERGLTRDAVLDSLVRAANIDVTWEPLRYLNFHYRQMREPALVVDGKPVALPLAARMEGGRMIMPVKPLLVALGASMRWDAKTLTLTASKGGKTVALTVGKPSMLVGGQPEAVLAPHLQESTMVAEPRPIVEGLGGSVRWDPVRNTLFVKSTPEAPEAPPEPAAEG